LRSHPGQISLPGGRVEAEDLSPWHAALRETWEEIRVIPERIAPVGRLCPVQVTVSNNLVIPFVGSLSQHPSPAPSSAEVEEVFEVPVSSLLDPSRVEEDTWVLRDGRSYVVTYYRLCDYVVWGVTARILSDLAGHLGARQGAYPPGSVRPAA
jgi:8-oxo-dGTP pyrophosphatase MutT (NUDIX family)